MQRMIYSCLSKPSLVRKTERMLFSNLGRRTAMLNLRPGVVRVKNYLKISLNSFNIDTSKDLLGKTLYRIVNRRYRIILWHPAPKGSQWENHTSAVKNRITPLNNDTSALKNCIVPIKNHPGA